MSARHVLARRAASAALSLALALALACAVPAPVRAQAGSAPAAPPAVAAAPAAGRQTAALPGAASPARRTAAEALPVAVTPPVPAVPSRTASAPVAAVPESPHPLEAADLAAWLDGRVPYALKSGAIAGAVVIVVKDGKVLLQKGYGLADVAGKVPMDPETTLVRPGSTSKLLTWTAVMQLVQQGKIDLDRSVNDYLDFRIPEAFGKPVTMRDLMNHRAGFEEDLKDIIAYDPTLAQTTEQYLKRHPRPMLFAPGAVPAYSNYGAALAGYIVERVSGEPFDSYVERHIFLPLGMRHSTFTHPLPDKFQARAAKGYRGAGDAPSAYELVVTRPAGSMAATAADMGRFMLAHLQQGSLDGYAMLDPATTARMHSPSQTGPLGFGVMAHGFISVMQNGHRLIGHGGDTIVFHTELNLLPEAGTGIFFSFNSRGKDAAVYGARKELFDGFMDRYFPAGAAEAAAAANAPALASAPADARRIAGRYQSSRRIEHGFLSALYLLDQTVITANADGTITAPGGVDGGTATYREVGPQLWRKVGGTQMLALAEVDGVRTVTDSDNPVSVLQEADFFRSAPLNLTVLGLSLVILLATLALWPAGALLLRADRAASGASAEQRRLRRVQRLAVLVQAVYLAAWLALIQPVLDTDLAIYNSANDWIVGLLQLSGVLAVAAAAAGVWAAWRMRRSGATRLSRAWSVLVALALLGVVWIGIAGRLIGWNLNY